MPINLLLGSILFLLAATCPAQTISWYNENGKPPYAIDGVKLNQRDLAARLRTLPANEELVRKAGVQRLVAPLLGIVGVALLGHEIYDLSEIESDFNITIAGPGTALTIAALLMASSANRKYAEAVTLYNEKQYKTSLRFGNTRNGAGLTYTF